MGVTGEAGVGPYTMSRHRSHLSRAATAPVVGRW